MKKIITLFSIAAALLTACKKEATKIEVEGIVKVLTVQMPEITRTTLGEEADGKMPVLWAGGDKIKVENGSQSAIYELSNGDGSATGTFKYLEGDVFETMTKITYPFTYNDATLKWQLYHENSFDQRCNLMEWESEEAVPLESSVSLKQKNSLVCIRLYGNPAIQIAGIALTLTKNGEDHVYNIQPKDSDNNVVPMPISPESTSFNIFVEPVSDASASLKITHRSEGVADLIMTQNSTSNHNFEAGRMLRFSMPAPLKLYGVASAFGGWGRAEKNAFNKKDNTTLTWTGDLVAGDVELAAEPFVLKVLWDKTNQSAAPTGNPQVWDAKIFANVTPAPSKIADFVISRASNYTIDYNVVNNTLSIKDNKPAPPVYDMTGLWIYGPTWGKFADKVQMTTTDDDTYVYQGIIKASANHADFKFICNASKWWPEFVRDANDANKILYSNGSPDLYWSVPEDGEYKVTVKISDLSIKIERIVTPSGKPEVVILGDSYSTYPGAVPASYPSWYDGTKNGVTSVDMCWWKLVCDEMDYNVLYNSSYSGSCICSTGYSGADATASCFATRAVNDIVSESGVIGNCGAAPDIVFILGGTNDKWAASPLGELVSPTDWKTADKSKTIPAMCYILGLLKNNLPETRIIVINNDWIGDEIPAGLKSAAESFECECINLDFGSSTNKQDGHPTAAGMRAMADQIKSYLNN